MGGSVKKAAKTVGGAVGTGLMLGTNKIKGSPMEKMGNGISAVFTGGLSGFGGGGGGGVGSPSMGGQENPAAMLAQTGGAPLLANIALGANIDDSIAGYFGKGDFNSFYSGLSPADKGLVDGVKKQLTSIQSNTELKNKAVQQVVNDFPNIVAAIGQQAGKQFDEVTQGYVDQALNKVGAKYAAGGNLSSGAMAAASARTGADIGMQKFDYMQQQGMAGWQARYNETNALRNFQNLMTQGQAGAGFSAAQASLNRNQQTQMNNAQMQNQANIANQQSQDNMFGAIGSLVGAIGGAAIMGPAGAMAGNKLGSMAGQSASDYGFSGASTPGYARNNYPRLYGIGG